MFLDDRSPGTRSKRSLSPNFNLKSFKSIAIVVKDQISCIPQDSKFSDLFSKIKLNRNEQVTLVKELPEMNLSLCEVNIKGSSY